MSTRRATLDPRSVVLIERVLQGGPAGWGEPPGRYSEAFLDALRGALGALQVPTAVAAAYSALRGERPLAPSHVHETWARATVAWAARELCREALLDTGRGGAIAPEVERVAQEMLAAAMELGDAQAQGPLAPTERLVRAALAALAAAHGAAPVDAVASAYVSECLLQLKHALPVLAAGNGSIRGALVRADRSAQRHARLSLPSRRALARLGLAEAAGALAVAAAREAEAGGDGPQVGAWLARTACRLGACAPYVTDWLAPSPDDAAHDGNEGADASDADASTSARATHATHATHATTTNARTTGPENSPMTTPANPTKQPILKTLEADAMDAAWRTAGSQFVKLAREPLVAALSRHLGPGDDAMRGKIAAFLDTEIGGALLASLLSMGLTALPRSTGEVPQRLARELRVRAMSDAGDVLADVLMGPLRQVMVLYLQDVAPAAEAAAGHAPAALDAGASGASVFAIPTASKLEAVG